GRHPGSSGSGDRPRHWRLPDRDRRLALDLLRERSGQRRGDHDRTAHARAGRRAAATAGELARRVQPAGCVRRNAVAGPDSGLCAWIRLAAGRSDRPASDRGLEPTPSSRPVVDLVRTPGMVGPLAALLVNVTAIAGTGFIAPFYLQQALHTSAAVTGLTVIALPIGMSVTSQVGGYIAARWGARQMTAVGTAVIAMGLGLIAPLSGSWHPVDLGWRLAVVGIGLGLFAGPNMAAAMQQAPRHLLATAGATTSLARSLAFAL